MGFANNVRSSAVPEWRDFYIDYDRLRARIKRRNFKPLLYAELTKINKFYILLEKRAIDEKNRIFDEVSTELPAASIAEIRAMADAEDGSDNDSHGTPNPSDSEETKNPANPLRPPRHGASRPRTAELAQLSTIPLRHIEESESGDEDTPSESSSAIRDNLSGGIRRLIRMPHSISRRRKEKTITEFLHSLMNITAYRDLNGSTILKLAKRHAEACKAPQLYDDFLRHYRATYFHRSRKIEQIRAATKQLYKRLFAKNQPEKARRVFRRIRKGVASSDWLFIASGFLIGVAYAAALCLFSPLNSAHEAFWAVSNIYLGFILFGLCMKVFKAMTINYKFIFNFDVCSSMNNSLFLLLVALLVVANVCAYGLAQWVEPQIYSLLVAIQAAVLFLPFDVLFYNSRLYLISTYTHALCQPLSTIRFRHFYFVDIVQSFTFPIAQLLRLFGVENTYLLLGARALFPAVRILQCLKRYSGTRLAFPHLANCVKFSMGLLFMFSQEAEQEDASFVGVSMVVGAVCTVAALVWDLVMDWAVFRPRFLFPRPMYMAIAVYSVIVRMLWITRYARGVSVPVLGSMAEIVRRFLWTLIRVEVEHLNNCDEFKVKSAAGLAAAELFYKKDQVEVYRARETDTETETETESVRDYEDVPSQAVPV